MKYIVVAILCFLSLSVSSQSPGAFDVGEHFKFKVNYQFINAGYFTLDIHESVVHNKKTFHIVGKGATTGMSRFFFKVDDIYESYVDKDTRNPHHFVRKINEGGYTKNQEGFFNHAENKVVVKDYKHKTESSFPIPPNTQDILSSFYYLRNHPSIEKMNPGDFVGIDMFFDEKTTKFRLKFVGHENIKTKFGAIAAMVFKPYVQTGRIFKEQESLTVWVSDDANRIPLRIKASLVVGSIKAELDSYKGLKHQLKLVKK